MNSNGVILKRLRLINRLTVKQAAKHIGRSSGWISAVENGDPKARLMPEEFERVLRAYGGDAYRRQFGGWIAKQEPKVKAVDLSFGGSVLKYLRTKKSMSLQEAASAVGRSIAYLSDIENGKKPLRPVLRDKLMGVYGYSPSSFKNFASEDKRAANVPVRFKLQALLKRLDDEKIAQLFKHALEMSQTTPDEQSIYREERKS